MTKRYSVMIMSASCFLLFAASAVAAPATTSDEVGAGNISIAPLLTTHWHQHAPYNNMSPIVVDGNFRTVAGCVAIATAQVIYYWHRDNPAVTSFDTPTYPYGKAPVTYSVPQGTAFEWDLIHDSYTLDEPIAEQEAVARLVYVTGTSAWLDYGSSTGGNIYDVIAPLSSQFNLNAKYARHDDFTQQGWEQLLYEELVAGRPVLYAGSNGKSGHAVVIDGYDAERRLFHFNFGWGGSEDGYYTVDAVTGMHGYVNDQKCIYGISPKKRNIVVELNLPETFEVGVPSSVEVVLTNNSTLAINGLYLFLDSNIIPQALSSSVASSLTKLESGSCEHRFLMTFTPRTVGTNSYLVLTDESMNVLAMRKVIVNENTGITSRQIPQIRLNRSGDGLLLIEADQPTRVSIRKLDGCEILNVSVYDRLEVPLQHGLFIINGQKWLQ